MSEGGLRFAVATFERVFDVTPVQDALTLPELTAPAVANPRAPRDARVIAGPLLDATLAGVAPDDAPPPLPPPSELSPGLLRPRPEDAVVEDAVDLEDDALWTGGVTTEATPEATPEATAAPSPSPATDLAPVLERLDAILARLDALGRHAVVDGLERLALLYEQGALDASEYQAAKSRLLPPDVVGSGRGT